MKLRTPFFNDVMVSVFCTAGVCLCLFLFWKDLNSTFSRLGEMPVGTITFRYNTAQRRFIDKMIWDRLRDESPVYNGDLIRTADLSEATITFAGGDIVEMTSNTLVQIFVDKDAPRIDFSGGGINVNASSGMVIASGDKRLTIDPGAVLQASASHDGALDLAVSEGAAVLESSDPQSAGAQGTAVSHIIAAGSALAVNAAGETQSAPRAAAVFPPPGARFLCQDSEGLSLEFTWNKIDYPDDGLTRLDIAHDRSFSRTYFSQTSSGSRLSVVLPEGTWFWRLYPATEDSAESSAQSRAQISYSKLTVVSSSVPALKNPQEGQVFRYTRRPPSLRFQWTSSEEASSYILEAADNIAMQNPSLRLNVRSSSGDMVSAMSSGLSDGTWYWRVTPVYSRDFSGNPSPSQTGIFTIARGADLTAPVLTAPLDGAILNIETGMRDILFSWKKENEAASYTLRVSSNSDMRDHIIEETLTDTFYRYGAGQSANTLGVITQGVIREGTWYWTVYQTSSAGDVSPVSAPRTFNAMRGEVIQRQIFPPDDYTVAENLLPDMRFTWKTNLADTRFQVSQREDFASSVINEGAPAEAYIVHSLRPGVYYWRITGGSETQLLESRSRRFTVAESLPPPKLSPPESDSLAAQNGIVAIRQGQVIDFSWESAPDAEYYAFKLYRGNDLLNPIMETIVSSVETAVNIDNYEDGSYTWTVQGLARENSASSRRTGLASTQTINIRHLRPVVLEYPQSGHEYLGIDASRNPDTARWSSQDFPVNVVFIIARDQRMRDIVHRQTNPPSEILLPRLSAGDYYWTIQAEIIEGIDISASAPSHFRVLPIPLLPVPPNRLPAAMSVIGPEQIRKSRSVDFHWDKTEGANGYILTIFQNAVQNSGASRKTVLQTPILTETGYLVEDIRLLGRGDFFWQVEALYVMDNDFIEQRGQLRENSFIVDIQPPAQIKTIDSGVLYGN
ncbi:MAG: hypothetical protein LBI04_06650 [Treponema sp.]|jgi:hypothetical protein|nr:hypothetical protein [Treponema sp.]